MILHIVQSTWRGSLGYTNGCVFICQFGWRKSKLLPFYPTSQSLCRTWSLLVQLQRLGLVYKTASMLCLAHPPHKLRKTGYSLRMKMIPTCFLQETMNTQGQQREREAAAYEARMFCEMLLKGAVNIFEVRICCHGNCTWLTGVHSLCVLLKIVFADEIVYASEAWKVSVSVPLWLVPRVPLVHLTYASSPLLSSTPSPWSLCFPHISLSSPPPNPLSFLLCLSLFSLLFLSPSIFHLPFSLRLFSVTGITSPAVHVRESDPAIYWLCADSHWTGGEWETYWQAQGGQNLLQCMRSHEITWYHMMSHD